VNLDPDKLVVLFVIALLVLGPKRLPEVARTAGRWMAEVRKYTSAIQGELHGVLGEPLKQTSALRDEFRSAMAEPRAALDVGAREVRSSFDAGSSAPGTGGPLVVGNGAGPAAGASAPPVTARVPPAAVPDDPGFN
jgi:sec-independent protein translocase protein TatB